MKVTALTKVGNYGWEAYGFEISGLKKFTGIVSLEVFTEDGPTSWELTDVYRSDDIVRVMCRKFSYFQEFVLTVGEKSVTRDTVDEVRTLWADLFEDCRTDKFWYRLYSPKTDEPRPLLLFLHGGGECGTDNWKQMVNTLGAARFSELYPDICVMAPQTPVDERKQVEEANGSLAYSEARMYGWTKEFMQLVCAEIRRLISVGKVDGKRVYVVGSGRGGGGAFLGMQADHDLFAAAAPVSPRITPEVTEAMLDVADIPVWISIPYVDERPERTKYIVDAVMAMKDKGGKNIHLTIYSPEDLARYGIGADADLPFEQRIKDNHRAWILTYNNEGGILDWLMEQHK